MNWQLLGLAYAAGAVITFVSLAAGGRPDGKVVAALIWPVIWLFMMLDRETQQRLTKPRASQLSPGPLPIYRMARINDEDGEACEIAIAEHRFRKHGSTLDGIEIISVPGAASSLYAGVNVQSGALVINWVKRCPPSMLEDNLRGVFEAGGRARD